MRADGWLSLHYMALHQQQSICIPGHDSELLLGLYLLLMLLLVLEDLQLEEDLLLLQEMGIGWV